MFTVNTRMRVMELGGWLLAVNGDCEQPNDGKILPLFLLGGTLAERCSAADASEQFEFFLVGDRMLFDLVCENVHGAFLCIDERGDMNSDHPGAMRGSSWCGGVGYYRRS